VSYILAVFAGYRQYVMGRECSTNREKKNVYRILVGKPERKRPKETTEKTNT
jgi:hypothetical protein